MLSQYCDNDARGASHLGAPPRAVAAGCASARHHVVKEKVVEALTPQQPHAGESLHSLTVEKGEPERFCPLCGLRYPATSEFRNKESAPLQDVIRSFVGPRRKPNGLT